MATIYINKEEYAVEAAELLNARWDGFVGYGEKLMSDGEYPDQIREKVEYRVEKDMEEALFEHLKRRGIVCGDIDQLYNKYGSCRRIRLRTNEGEASFNLLNIKEVLPNFGEVVGNIMLEAKKLRIIAAIETITEEARVHNYEV